MIKPPDHHLTAYRAMVASLPASPTREQWETAYTKTADWTGIKRIELYRARDWFRAIECGKARDPMSELDKSKSKAQGFRWYKKRFVRFKKKVYCMPKKLSKRHMIYCTGGPRTGPSRDNQCGYIVGG